MIVFPAVAVEKRLKYHDRIYPMPLTTFDSLTSTRGNPVSLGSRNLGMVDVMTIPQQADNPGILITAYVDL